MKAETKRKLAVGALRGGAYAATAALPIAVLAAKFPMVVEKTSESVSLSVSAVLAIIIMLVTLRAQVWSKIKEKLGINSIGILLVYGVGYVLMLGIETIYPIVSEIQTVCIAGLAGTAAGQAMSSAAKVIEEKSGMAESKKGVTTDVI